MQTDKEFEDFFRERLNGLEETPPFNAWNKIKEDIKPPRTYYREMAAVVLLCLISAVIFLGIKKQPAQTGQPEIAVANKTNAAQNQAIVSERSPEFIATNSNVTEKTNRTSANETLNETQNSSPAKTSEEIAASGLLATQNIAANSSAESKPLKANLHIALLKKDKTRNVKPENTAAENKLNNPGTALTFTAKAARPAAYSAEKRYGSMVKNSAEAVVLKSEKAPVTTKEINQIATATNEGISSETKAAKPENNSLNAPETATILAQATLARTDSVALPAIPEMLADSAGSAKKAVAQRHPEAKSKAGKFAVTVNFTPGVIARRLIANRNDDHYLRFTESSKGDKTNLGFDFSATVHHRVSPKTTIDGGFSYTKLHSNVTYQISNGDLKVVSTPNPGNSSAAVKVDYAFADEEFQNEFAYGGIRVGLTQELVNTNAHKLFVSGGAGLNKLLSNSGTLSTTNGTSTEEKTVTNALHTVNSHVYLSAGIEKQVLPKVSILVAPAFTYYLNSAMQKKHIFEMRPYTFGLNFGLRYQL
jgi:hypothetical protein